MYLILVLQRRVLMLLALGSEQLCFSKLLYMLFRDTNTFFAFSPSPALFWLVRLFLSPPLSITTSERRHLIIIVVVVIINNNNNHNNNNNNVSSVIDRVDRMNQDPSIHCLVRHQHPQNTVFCILHELS